MRKFNRLLAIMMAAAISLTMVFSALTINAEETEGAEGTEGTPTMETNLTWTPVHKANGQFEITETEFKASESYERVYAVSNQMVSDMESFTFELEYDMVSMSNDDNVINQGWLSQEITFGLLAGDAYQSGDTPSGSNTFTIRQKSADGGYFMFGSYRSAEEMTDEEAAGGHMSITVKYLATTGYISFTVNGRVVAEEEFFQDEGYLGLASAWCGWNITKAVFTAYPDGLPEEENVATPVPTEPAATDAPSDPTEPVNTEEPSDTTEAPKTDVPSATGAPAATDATKKDDNLSVLPIIIAVCAVVAVIVIVIIIVLKKSGKGK